MAEYNDTQRAMAAELGVRKENRDKAKDESFEKVEHSLAHKKDVENPKALAAWIGREHGKIP